MAVTPPPEMISLKLKVAVDPLKLVVERRAPFLIRLRDVICPADAPVSVKVKLLIVTLEASGLTS